MSLARILTQRKLRDEAVSPVVGTIMMVAVTVVLAATVAALMGGFGDQASPKSTNAVVRAQAIDTDGDSLTDTIKLTYITGPSNANIVIKTVDSTGAATTALSTTTTWSPGEFIVNSPGAGSYFITATVEGIAVLDTSITLDE